ncbi:MAG: hypothetical protein ACK506_18990 [Pirellula sp.]
MNDLFDDPTTIGLPKKRGKKAKVKSEQADYDPDRDRELTRAEIELIWKEKALGYTASQTALRHRLPMKRTELALTTDYHWYKRVLERLDLIAKYSSELFDYVGSEMSQRQHEEITESEIAGVPIADAQRIWALQWLPDRPSDLANVNYDREAEALRKKQQEKQSAFTYWLRKLDCSTDIAELVRRTAAGEPFPELGDTVGQSDEESESIFGSFFDNEEVDESDIDNWLPQELIDQCNKRIATWLDTKSLPFANQVRRNLWKYYAFIDSKRGQQAIFEARRRYKEQLAQSTDEDD